MRSFLSQSLLPKTVLLRLWYEKSSYYIVISHIISIFKRFVYLKRKETNYVNFNGLKAFIKEVDNTEQQIASRKEKEDILTENEPYTASDV